jgi:hypothetical protein
MRIPIYINAGNHIGLIDDAEASARRGCGVSLRVESAYWKTADVNRAVSICDAQGAKIALVAGPFAHWTSPAYPDGMPSTDRGPEYQREIDRYRSQYALIAADLGPRKDLVGAILIDMEYWQRPKDSVHNKAMAETLDILYEDAAAAFPTARIEFYCRGVYWDQPSAYWTGLERHVPSLSVSLSCPNHPAMMERWFNVTVEMAKTRGVDSVTPWVHIGFGYDKGDASHYGPITVNPAYARWLGGFLASSPFVKCVVVHPAPGASQWEEHFENFRLGLNGNN